MSSMNFASLGSSGQPFGASRQAGWRFTGDYSRGYQSIKGGGWVLQRLSLERMLVAGLLVG